MRYLPTEYCYISQAANHSFLVKHTLQVRFSAKMKAPLTADDEIKYVTFFPGQEKGMSVVTYLMKIPWTIMPLKNREYMVENTELQIHNKIFVTLMNKLIRG